MHRLKKGSSAYATECHGSGCQCSGKLAVRCSWNVVGGILFGGRDLCRLSLTCIFFHTRCESSWASQVIVFLCPLSSVCHRSIERRCWRNYHCLLQGFLTFYSTHSYAWQGSFGSEAVFNVTMFCFYTYTYFYCGFGAVWESLDRWRVYATKMELVCSRLCSLDSRSEQ